MKSKKVITIIMSLALMFTFMPSLAFAADAASWDDRYAGVTDTSKEHFDTKRTFSEDTGLITAVPQNKPSGTIGQPDKEAPAVTKYYYDLEGAALVYQDGVDSESKPVYKPVDGTTWTSQKFSVTNFAVKMVEPAYADGYKAETPKSAVKTSSDGVVALTAWDLKISSDYDATKLYQDQTVKLTVKAVPNDTVTSESQIDGSETKPNKWGAVAEATITVKGADKTPSTAVFYFDSTDGDYALKDGKLVGQYDGAAHKIVCDTVKDYTVAYSVYDDKAGQYVKTDAVTITDVAEAVKVKATFTKADDATTEERIFTARLASAGDVKIAFKEGEEGYSDPMYLVSGSTYDAASYIEIAAVKTYDKNMDTELKPAARLYDAATEKAVTANKTMLQSYFKDYYTIKTSTSKYNPNIVSLKIESKDLTAAEEKELDKKYEALNANFGTIIVTENDDANVALNGVDPRDDEIEFTSAPTKKTYKGTNTTKKGVLKKTKTFTVEAKANNGAVVKYKLVNAPKNKITINATSGKITVKKGLKKGTYTFKVKAYIPGSYTFLDKNASETQTIKIYVKK